ncbi:MAG: MerR family DNA-binding transcriptional regulator, partial [Candidatus Daviesbacteria bacterium]|nr:MerR family DNA-binding transcriptional regulator [Candidatus Daviesbacteria bacterium]
MVKKNQTDVNTESPLVKIGEAAKHLGVSIDTLRRWEKAGKLPSIRTPGGTRLYNVQTLQAIKRGSFISASQEIKPVKSQPTPDLQAEALTPPRAPKPIYSQAVILTSPSLEEFRVPTEPQVKPKRFPKVKLAKYAAAFLSLVLFTTTALAGFNLYSPSKAQQFFATASGLSPLNDLAKAGILTFVPKEYIPEELSQEALAQVPREPDIFRGSSPNLTLSPDLENLLPQVLAESTIGQFLEISADTRFLGTIEASGAATLGTTLDVLGKATFEDEVEVKGTTTLTGDLTIAGNSTVADLISSGQIKSTGNIADRILLQPSSDPSTATKLLTVKNAAGVEQASLDSSGNLLLTGNETVSGTFKASGASTLSSTLTVSGATTLSSALEVSGTSTLSGALTVSGASTLSSTLKVSGATTLSSTLAVTGASTLASTLAVTGASTLSSTLAVTGASTLSSTLAVTGALTQTGEATFASTVALSSLSSESGTSLCINSSNQIVTCASGSSVSGTGVAGALAYWSSTTALSYNINNFWDNTNNRLGIGTSAPSQSFQVNADTSNPVVITSGGNLGVGTTSPTTTFAVGTGATSNFTVTSAGVVSIASTLGVTGVTTLSANNSALSFTGTTPSITSGSSVFGIFAGGNVGIGTTGPLAGALTVRGTGTTTALSFLTTDSSGTQRFAVTDAGNVGIGTTSPGAKLDIIDTSNTAASFGITNNTITTLGAGINTAGMV